MKKIIIKVWQLRFHMNGLMTYRVRRNFFSDPTEQYHVEYGIPTFL